MDLLVEMGDTHADMVNLTTLDEASMLENLKARFESAPGSLPHARQLTRCLRSAATAQKKKPTV